MALQTYDFKLKMVIFMRIFMPFRMLAISLCLACLALFMLPDTLASGESAAGKSQKFWIFLNDKGPRALAKDAAALENAKARLTTRALARRAKVLAPDALIDQTDVEVYQPYLDALSRHGLKPITISRWLNALTVKATPEQIKAAQQLPFVDKIQVVATLQAPPAPRVQPEPGSSLQKAGAPHRFSYGPSLTQMEQIRATDLHDAGISGRGVLVGMFDSGFRWQAHEAFQHLKNRIVAERDFVEDDEVTRNETGDRADQDNHGTQTFSVLGGFQEGQLIGPAYSAHFILAKTEHLPTETHAEEDYWVAAMEWMEQMGVEVTSTSLGYSEFDFGQTNYTPADMDGKTAIITKAAEIAVSKGIIVVNSVGNEGDDNWGIITAPADGPNVIAVGAVNAAGNVLGFSGRGPTADGRIKPDVMAMGIGVQAVVTGSVSNYTFVSGTSFSCPLTAGVVTQILSAHPGATPQQVMNALRSTASLANSPDNEFGYGIVDAVAAITALGPAFSNMPQTSAGNGTINVSTKILSRDGIAPGSVRVYYAERNNSNFLTATLTASDETTYAGTIPRPSSDTTHVKIYFAANDNNFGEVIYPQNAPDEAFLVRGDGVLVDVDNPPPTPPTTFVLEQSSPNPFRVSANASATIISFALAQAAPVSIRIYNMLGQEVRELLSGPREAGRFEVAWDGRDRNGRLLASGVYVYVIKTPQATASKKLLLLR